jgi:preprotein translocase subunit YajC
MGLIVLVLMFGVIYMLVIVPNQRRVKAHKQLLAALEVGDLVVTASGIHGAIAELDESVVWLEVAPDVELKISRSAVAERLGGDDEYEDEDDDDEEEDEVATADAGDDES